MSSDALSKEEVLLFVSFDLVNSTQFKTRYENWPHVIKFFYEKTIGLVQKERHGENDYHVWKLVGDEVLFYQHIPNLETLAKSVQHLFSCIATIIKDLEDAGDEQFKGAPICNFLSVKSTAWIARVAEHPKQQQFNKYNNAETKNREEYHNFGGPISSALGLEKVDFLGPDIDAGFRISKYAQKRILTVCPKLAYLINSAKELGTSNTRSEYFKIVEYAVLKGVWDEMPYPIVWYFNPWPEINKTFHYADKLKTKEYNFSIEEWKIAQNITNVLDEKVHSVKELKNIFEDLGRSDDVDKLLELLQKPENDKLKPEWLEVGHLKRKKNFGEIHCAAICFNKEGKILMAKRASTKPYLPNVWEFGCGQVHKKETLKSCMEEAYTRDFGISLRNISPLPISGYEINREEEEEKYQVSGLLYYAETDTSENTRPLSSKHSDIKWFSPEELEAMTSDELVPDCVESANTAFRYRKNSMSK